MPTMLDTIHYPAMSCNPLKVGSQQLNFPSILIWGSKGQIGLNKYLDEYISEKELEPLALLTMPH